MYYVVFTGNVVHYLGPDKHYASEVWIDQDCKNGATLAPVDSLEQLRLIFNACQADPQEDFDDCRYEDPEYRERVEEPVLSEAAARLFDKLDELGLSAENTDNWAREFKKNGDKVVAEVKSLGIKSMKAVGEGFKALGDLLRNEAEGQEEMDDEFIRDLEDLQRRDEDGWRS
jgi:hypothetical protein